MVPSVSCTIIFVVFFHKIHRVQGQYADQVTLLSCTVHKCGNVARTSSLDEDKYPLGLVYAEYG